jgi:exonuclease SbcD
MRILHTADWHLGDRLGRIDRTDDLRRAVERVADYCHSEKVDVLLVAGDIFSELARPDVLRDAIGHLQGTFTGFLSAGGTILAITGNHDNEGFCQTLWHAMNLASPAREDSDGRARPGRLHLATVPTLLRVADQTGRFAVQFVLMPYPTPNRYLDGRPATRYSSLDERNRQLIDAFSRKLKELYVNPRFDPKQPNVLAAHLSISGGQISPLFRLSEPEDLVLPREELAGDFAYIALGHIHKPQVLAGRANVRYCGSIERLDLGEQNDAKGAVLIDLGPDGLRAEPVQLPLPATSIYEVDIVQPKEQLPTLAERFPGAHNDLVHLHISYTAGVDNLEEILAESERVFPRWYARDWRETSMLGPALTIGNADRQKSFEDTVRDYLRTELMNHPEDEQAALLDRVERLLREA